VPAAGGINSNIKDMSLWMLAQMGEMPDVLSPQAARHDPRAVVKTPGERGALRKFLERLGDAWYGYGWRSYDYAGHHIVGHRGGVNGYRSLILFDPAAEERRGRAVEQQHQPARRARVRGDGHALPLPFRDWMELDKEWRKRKRKMRWRCSRKTIARSRNCSPNSRKASGDGRKQKLATQICLELSVHAKIEEEIFYPACEGKVDEDLLKEAYVEHDGAKLLIAEIMAGEPSDEFYDAKVTVLQEQIEHHVEEEEKRLEGPVRAGAQGRARHGRAGRAARRAQGRAVGWRI
jgi:hypothetical protein